MTTERPEPPYPAKTKAGGWKFELDPDAINQSDTWALAGGRPAARAWLVLLWYTAWQQIPCGSLPNDDELIAAHIGMPLEEFAVLRPVLLRNWWLASDGRLYLDTIASQVLAMLGRKKSERERKAAWRDRKASKGAPADAGNGTPEPAAETPAPEGPQPPADAGAGSGAQGGEHGEPPPERTQEQQREASTAYGAMARAIRRAGIVSVSTGHPTFRMLVDAGVTFDEFNAFIPSAKDKESPFNYLVASVAKARTRAAETASRMHHGPLPGAAPPLDAAFMNRARAAAGLLPAEADDKTIEMPA